MIFLKKIYKKLIYNIFFLIYGRIDQIENDASILNSILSDFTIEIDSSKYKIYHTKKTRLYTDTINDAAAIYNNKILDSPSFQLRNKLNSNIGNNIVLKIGTPKLKKKVSGTVLSLLTGGAGNDSYFHWLYDVLPKIYIYESSTINKKIDYYLFPDTKFKYQKETIEALEINKNKILSSKKFRHIESDELIITSHPWVLTRDPKYNDANVPIWITKWLRKKFLDHADRSNKHSTKIYIDRSDSRSNTALFRNIVNEKEVVNLLIKNNFQIIKLSSLNFLDQVKLFNDAKIIVGLHGGGFANLAFCNAQCRIIEFRSSTTGDLYKNISSHNNLAYSDITVESSDKPIAEHFGSFEIPLELLKKLIR